MRDVRRLALIVAVTAVPAASPLPAQGPPKPAPPIPFAVPAEFEKFFQSPFEPLSEEQEAALAGIEIPAEDEAALGEEAVAAYVADMKRQNVPVLARGRDVEYLQALV